MRGPDHQQTAMFSYVSIEDRIPPDHPLRSIQALVNPVLAELSPRFQAMYATRGRPSIPPERLLRAMLLQILFTIRSERQLMEQLNYDLLFRWFVGLNPDDAVWVPTMFTKNRDRPCLFACRQLSKTFYRCWSPPALRSARATFFPIFPPTPDLSILRSPTVGGGP